MLLTKQKPLVAVGVVLIFMIGGAAIQGHRQPAALGAQEHVKATPQTTIPSMGSGSAALPDLAADRALARQQLVVIDEAWAMLENLYANARIEADGGNVGVWGRRRFEALRRAGAEKAEIVAAMEKYVNDLKRLQQISLAKKNPPPPPNYEQFEIEFLRMEAEIWLNEEKAR